MAKAGSHGCPGKSREAVGQGFGKSVICPFQVAETLPVGRPYIQTHERRDSNSVQCKGGWGEYPPVKTGMASGEGEYRAMIDLQSDTCSRPTAEMRKALAEADVGDDVYGDDSTVKALEAATAGIRSAFARPRNQAMRCCSTKTHTST
jgi:Beta-eliminating lyase